MWRNPNHPQPPSQAAPEPTGRLLATFERPGRGRGPDAELRVDLDEYQGNPYLSLRIWSRGADGSWYPTRKGLSVRINEAEDVAAALVEGVRLATAPQARPTTRSPPRRPERRPTAPARPQLSPVPADVGNYDPGFDEFD